MSLLARLHSPFSGALPTTTALVTVYTRLLTSLPDSTLCPGPRSYSFPHQHLKGTAESTHSGSMLGRLNALKDVRVSLALPLR